MKVTRCHLFKGGSAGRRTRHALRSGPLVLAGRQRQHDQARDVGRQSSRLQVFSFKQPSSEELDHDFMWRCVIRMPERGRIGIFNRSYYEEVLVVRVHPETLKRQKMPPRLVSKSVWDERLADIAHFENYISRQGTKILKFFLHVSRKEQKKRFTRRLDEPEKNCTFSPSDVMERKFWGRTISR